MILSKTIIKLTGVSSMIAACACAWKKVKNYYTFRKGTLSILKYIYICIHVLYILHFTMCLLHYNLKYYNNFLICRTNL